AGRGAAGAMDGHRLGLALEGQRIEGLEVEGVPGEEIRSVTHECLPARGRRLEPGRGVDGVARDGVGRVLTAEMTGHDAPGVDSDAKGDLAAKAPGPARIRRAPPGGETGGGRGPRRGTVLGGGGSTNPGNAGVPHVFSHNPAVALDARRHLAEQIVLEGPYVLGIQAL